MKRHDIYRTCSWFVAVLAVAGLVMFGVAQATNANTTSKAAAGARTALHRASTLRMSPVLQGASSLRPPSNADVDPNVFLGGISCWSAGDCTAVGGYTGPLGSGRALVATETGGTWAQATEVTAPANAGADPEASLQGISCWSAGDCTAVGGYTDSSGSGQALVVTETGCGKCRDQ